MPDEPQLPSFTITISEQGVDDLDLVEALTVKGVQSLLVNPNAANGTEITVTGLTAAQALAAIKSKFRNALQNAKLQGEIEGSEF